MRLIATLINMNQYFILLCARFSAPRIRDKDDIGNSLSFVHNLPSDNIPALGPKKKARRGAMQSREHDPNGLVD
jgi:hypothetical protein